LQAISDLAVNQKFDLIVSTLPWSLFDQQMQQNILNQVKNHLERGGYFKTYMVCNALLTKSGKRFQSMLSEKFEVETSWEFINIPPAKVFECRLKC
jgi:phospholipid N-methyltransferase